jgi:predicted RNA-binding protein with TRAM domain
VKVNEVVEVEIQEVGKKGDGIARIHGFVIFVRNSKKGEHLKVKIIKVADRFAIAEPISE